MYGDLHVISAKGAEAALDLRGGHVRRFAVAGDGRTIEPTHTAPWVEDGAIAYPVDELTIASNLRDMFLGIEAVGADVDRRSATAIGSLLIGRMTVAGGAGE